MVLGLLTTCSLAYPRVAGDEGAGARLQLTEPRAVGQVYMTTRAKQVVKKE